VPARFRTVEGDLEAARRERELLVAGARPGALPDIPAARLVTVANRWLARDRAKEPHLWPDLP
jgi:hypothetical protein